MKTKKIENVVTMTGVGLLVFMTLVGFLFVFDLVYRLDIFKTALGKEIFGVICALVCILICSCAIVSAMLNISRIANSVESISEKMNGDPEKKNDNL